MEGAATSTRPARHPQLRQAVAAHQQRFYGLDARPRYPGAGDGRRDRGDRGGPDRAARPGDEVVAFEPYYDSYAASVAMAGAVRVPVTLRPPDFRPDIDALRAAVTARTRLILLNSPHNPTGAVFTRDELAPIAALACEHDLLVVVGRGLRALVFDGSAPAHRFAAWNVGAHGHDQLGGEDVLDHRLEDRLGHRAARTW